MRTVPYFHNMIGLLTETSHASASPRIYDPADRPEFVGNPRRGQAAPTNGTDVFYPYPWQGGESPFSDPIRYTLTASMAVLDVAADLREKWLFDIWRMGRDAIEGSGVSWIIPASQWDPGEAAVASSPGPSYPCGRNDESPGPDHDGSSGDFQAPQRDEGHRSPRLGGPVPLLARERLGGRIGCAPVRRPCARPRQPPAPARQRHSSSPPHSIVSEPLRHPRRPPPRLTPPLRTAPSRARRSRSGYRTCGSTGPACPWARSSASPRSAPRRPPATCRPCP